MLRADRPTHSCERHCTKVHDVASDRLHAGCTRAAGHLQPGGQEQTRQSLTNISAVLLAAGSSLEKVVTATVILVDEDDFAGMNEEWVRWFGARPPARQAAKLPVKVAGLKVSIACIAEA